MPISSALGSSALLPAGLGFRNKIINGGFDIWQRGTSFSSAGYTADRWIILADGSGATRTISQQTFTPGNAIPNQELPFFLRYNQSVAGTSATYNIIEQRIEDVRTCAGQSVTVSFWAKAGATLAATTQVQQNFGSGGSAEVQAVATQNITITTSWQRFTYTFTMPSISSKTIGTNSYVAFRINLPNNATFIFDLWGVQLEQNYQPTPFEQRPIGVELALCQRYFQTISSETLSSYNPYWNVNLSGGDQRSPLQFKVTMRATPTLLTTGGSTLHAFTYRSYNTGTATYNLDGNVAGTFDVHGIKGLPYYSTNNGGTLLPVGYTVGTNNNTIWVSAEL